MLFPDPACHSVDFYVVASHRLTSYLYFLFWGKLGLSFRVQDFRRKTHTHTHILHEARAVLLELLLSFASFRGRLLPISLSFFSGASSGSHRFRGPKSWRKHERTGWSKSRAIKGNTTKVKKRSTSMATEPAGLNSSTCRRALTMTAGPESQKGGEGPRRSADDRLAGRDRQLEAQQIPMQESFTAFDIINACISGVLRSIRLSPPKPRSRQSRRHAKILRVPLTIEAGIPKLTHAAKMAALPRSPISRGIALGSKGGTIEHSAGNLFTDTALHGP